MDSLFLLAALGVVLVGLCLIGVLYITYLTWKESLECDDYPIEYEVEE